MADGGRDNGMTEIALALAMAFFAIMILAMASMGLPKAVQFENEQQAVSTKDRELVLAEAEPAEGKEPTAATSEFSSERTIVIFWRGQFYNQEFQPIDAGRPQAPMALAVDPTLPMDEALELRRQFANADVVITPLSAEWLKFLRETQNEPEIEP